MIEATKSAFRTINKAICGIEKSGDKLGTMLDNALDSGVALTALAKDASEGARDAYSTGQAKLIQELKEA